LACHELSHPFGSRDKYTSDSNNRCLLENFGGDITCMAKYDPIKEDWEVPRLLSGIVVSDVTAAEMGWTDFDGDGILGIYDPKPFSKDND
ncbi:hypothetical protein KY308_01670, partial [Candidatus Woesearchaeota archaeon]|nr:hypothetical protein [Candidatus Woesearchaeota archaeon]